MAKNAKWSPGWRDTMRTLRGHVLRVRFMPGTSYWNVYVDGAKVGVSETRESAMKMAARETPPRYTPKRWTAPSVHREPAPRESCYTMGDARRDVAAAMLRVVERDMVAEIEAGERLITEGRPTAGGLPAESVPLAVAATREMLDELRARSRNGALPALLADLEEAERERDEALTTARVQRDSMPAQILDQCRGIQGKPCKGCGGWGIKSYGSTATWRGGVGGQAITSDVCDRCWGSGDAARPWPSWRLRSAPSRKAATGPGPAAKNPAVEALAVLVRASYDLEMGGDAERANAWRALAYRARKEIDAVGAALSEATELLREWSDALKAERAAAMNSARVRVAQYRKWPDAPKRMPKNAVLVSSLSPEEQCRIDERCAAEMAPISEAEAAHAAARARLGAAQDAARAWLDRLAGERGTP